MNWQTLRYGTLVVAGVAVTGTSIYVASRKQIKPVDVQILMEALEERTRAAHADTAPSPSIVTQSVQSWTPNTNGYTYEVPAGTNAPGSSNYLEYADIVDLVTTNDATGLQYQSRHREQVGRYIWAGWSNLTASTFPSGAGTNANLPYTLAGYADGVGYYTNARGSTTGGVYVLRDVRQREHGSNLGRGWILNEANVSTNVNPADWTYVLDRIGLSYFSTTGSVDSFRGDWFAINAGGVATPTGQVASVGALTVAEIRDEPADVEENQVNALGRTMPATNLFYQFDAILLDLVTNYVRYVDSATGVVYWTVADMFSTLGIGDGTNKFTKTVTNGVPVYGGVGRQIKRTNLVERYRVLQTMSQTVAVASYSTITTNAASNVVFTGVSDSGGGPHLPIPPGPLLGSPNYFVEPIYDSWITNAAGTLIPIEWLPFTVTASFPLFDQGYFNNATSRVFDGTFSAAAPDITVTTNTSAPLHSFKWYYRYDMASQVEWSEPPTQGYTQTITRLSQVFDADHADWSSNVVDATQFEVVFAADLTGTTYAIDFYVLNQDATNIASASYFQTGGWNVATSTNYTWATDLVQTNLSPTFSHDAGDFVIASNVGVGSRTIARATNRAGASPWGLSRAQVESTTNHDATVIYFGRRTVSNRALIKWNFNVAAP